jgi:putative ABC transport system permease protein
MLVKARGYAALAIGILALGIGANTAVFSILDGVLLRPPPYRDPDRLIDIMDQSRREARLRKLFSSYADFREYRDHASSIEAIGAAAWKVGSPIMTGRGPSRPLSMVAVSDGFFRVLGVSPDIGRDFMPSDAAGGCAVILARPFSKEVFGGDPAASGQSLILDGRSCAVLGVMPAGFAFYPASTQLWRVLTPELTEVPYPPGMCLVARLRPGAGLARARAELDALHTALHRGHGMEGEFRPAVNNLHSDFTWMAGRNLRTTVWVLLGAVGLVLSIACLNIANLQLGRSLARRRELAVRAALGAGRARLVRQLLTESLLLAAAGGSLGVGVAYAALRYFRAATPVELPVGAEIRLNLPVLLFSLGLSLVTALVFGLAPAWRSSRVNMLEVLKSGGRGIAGGRSRSARLLVAAQVAFSVTLLAGAGLLIESMNRMSSESLGFRAEQLYSAPIFVPQARYREEAARDRFYREIEARMAGAPGLLGVALADSAPPFGTSLAVIDVEERPVPPEAAVHDGVHESVSLGYFKTLGMTLMRGRLFDDRDRAESEQVAVIDEALAREYFPNADPLGKRIRVGLQRPPFPWVRIVGVVAPVKRTNLLREVGWVVSATMYRPMSQNVPDSVNILIRSAGEAAPLAAALRSAVAAVDPGVAVREVEPAGQRIAQAMTYPRFRAVVFGAFAAFALLLSAAGLYGVLSQIVAHRRQEIGVRIALGAQPGEIVRMVLRSAGAPVAGGLAIGISAAMLLGRWGHALLYGVTPADPVALAGTAMLLAVSAAVACALPARRAARTNPVDALRAE